MATSTHQEIVRALYDWEIAETREVFADSLNYDQIRVHECASWPDAIHILGHRLQRRPVNPAEHNAITLGYHCYFPVSMPRELTPVGNPFGMIWLIHELTHAWQYQHIGWGYLAKALWVQITRGEAGYQYGDEAGLVAARKNNLSFSFFNPEQQGNITRDYYIRRRTGQDSSAWLPYIDDLRA